jgi:hypothetical protein
MYVIVIGYPQSIFISVSATACGEMVLTTHLFFRLVHDGEIMALASLIGLSQEFFHREFTTIGCA